MLELFVVTHIHVFPGGQEEAKGIGTYLSKDDAESAIERFRMLPGFCDFPDNFYVACYPVGRDFWTAGYIERDNIEIPKWAQHLYPAAGESSEGFASRVLNDRYGKGDWPIGGRTEWHKIRQLGDRLIRKV